MNLPAEVVRRLHDLHRYDEGWPREITAEQIAIIQADSGLSYLDDLYERANDSRRQELERLASERVRQLLNAPDTS